MNDQSQDGVIIEEVLFEESGDTDIETIKVINKEGTFNVIKQNTHEGTAHYVKEPSEALVQGKDSTVELAALRQQPARYRKGSFGRSFDTKQKKSFFRKASCSGCEGYKS